MDIKQLISVGEATKKKKKITVENPNGEELIPGSQPWRESLCATRGGKQRRRRDGNGKSPLIQTGEEIKQQL